MTWFRNDSTGCRGLVLKGHEYVFLDPGETKQVPGHKVVHIPLGIIECEPPIDDSDPLPPPPIGLGVTFDHDGDGKPGGSLPHDPPALTSMTKAELMAQAEKEGIDPASIVGTGASGNILAKDIRDAIEAKRDASK